MAKRKPQTQTRVKTKRVEQIMSDFNGTLEAFKSLFGAFSNQVKNGLLAAQIYGGGGGGVVLQSLQEPTILFFKFTICD